MAEETIIERIGRTYTLDNWWNMIPRMSLMDYAKWWAEETKQPAKVKKRIATHADMVTAADGATGTMTYYEVLSTWLKQEGLCA